MSKYRDLLIPAIGGTALVLGVAYGVATRSYKAQEAELALAQAEAAKAQTAEKAAEITELQAKVLEIQETAKAQVREAALSGGTLSEPAPDRDTGFGLGRAALPEEIAAWDVDILPDGRGLPEGRGDVWTGEEVFADQCAACHGDFAEGVDNWPPLAGGFDTLGDKDPVKTVGSYWPYLSTVWDYVHRSMPFGGAQTLSDDEVYAIVAYILYSNDLVDEDFELSHENFADVQMHNSDGFQVDDRPDREYIAWRAEPCMENCKESVEITMRASVLNVTPEDMADDPAPAPTEAAVTEETDTEVAALDPGLVSAGEKVFKRCQSCHAVGPGAKSKTGPHLNALFGRPMGSIEGFAYSAAFEAALAEGRVWDEAELANFLTKPKQYIAGTKMAFSGLRKDEDLAAITAYLKSFAE